MRENVEHKGKYTQQKWCEFLDQVKERQLTSNSNYKDDLLSSMKSYAIANAEDLRHWHRCYKEATTSDFFQDNYALVSEKKIKKLLSRCKVMVLTANLIEKAILHYMIAEHSKEKIIRIICGSTAYFVLKWGNYWVAHVHQTETGANKDLGTTATVHDALKYFTPNVIFSIGVAFGIDLYTQNIGDVIVSKRILPYSENKRDEDMVRPDRSQDKSIDKWLHVRLANAIGFLDSVTYGDILTGGSVLSSFAEKDKICLGYSKSDFIAGGEMEGNALFQLASTDGIPGAVIKGICDWGVAKNDIFPEDPLQEEIFKDSLQAYAMSRVMYACDALFRDPLLFAHPKNEDIKALKRSYILCRIFLFFCTIVMFLYGFLGLSGTCSSFVLESTMSYLYNIVANPVLWLCISLLILLISCIDAYNKMRLTKFSSIRAADVSSAYRDLGNGYFEVIGDNPNNTKEKAKRSNQNKPISPA